MRIRKIRFLIAFLTLGVGILCVSLWNQNSHQDLVKNKTATDRTLFEENKQCIQLAKFFEQFQKAIADDDRQKVVSMMQYPLRVNFYSDPAQADYRFITNHKEFLKVYDKVFSDSVKEYISQIQSFDITGNDYFMQTGYGQIGIAIAPKNSDSEDEFDFDFKIKIISSNTIEIEHQSFLCGDTVDCYIKARNK